MSTPAPSRPHLSVVPAPSLAPAPGPVLVPVPDRADLLWPEGAPPLLDLVVPVYNEQDDLERCVRRLHAHLSAVLPGAFRITVADNASIDDTLHVAFVLADELPAVSVQHLAAKGRGRALAAAWAASDAAVLAYTDVDLSTDLTALEPLIAPLLAGEADIATGTRLASSSDVTRGVKREVISRCYNLLLRSSLGVRFSDAQCGFKAVRREAAEQLLPLVVDTGWFFDTELLVLAERAGLRVHEVPVRWVDDPDSRVRIVATAWEDVKGISRLTRALTSGALPLEEVRAHLGGERAEPRVLGVPRGMLGQVTAFAVVGVLSTLAYVLLFAALHAPLGAQGANLAALLVTAVANTAANRAVTFGVRGRTGALSAQVAGLIALGMALALTSTSLLVLHAAVAAPSRGLELGVLVIANVAATLVRFVVLRRWFARAAR